MKKGRARFFAPLADADVDAAPLQTPEELDAAIATFLPWMSGGDGFEVHSGRAGIVLAFLYLSEMETEAGRREEWHARARTEACGLLERRVAVDGCTFVNGEAGVLCVAAAACGGPAEQARAVQWLAEAAAAAVDAELPDELWYGRAGLLSAVLFAQDRFADGTATAALREAQLRLWDRTVAASDFTWHGTR